VRRAGVALVEVLIALVILASAGVSTIGYVAEVVHDRVLTEEREREVVRAEQLLIAHALLSRQELEQRIGPRTVGAHVVHVERPLPGLFRISVADASRPLVELIVTVVFRSEEVVADVA
jgi:hypothetical protein